MRPFLIISSISITEKTKAVKQQGSSFSFLCKMVHYRYENDDRKKSDNETDTNSHIFGTLYHKYTFGGILCPVDDKSRHGIKGSAVPGRNSVWHSVTLFVSATGRQKAERPCTDTGNLAGNGLRAGLSDAGRRNGVSQLVRTAISPYRYFKPGHACGFLLCVLPDRGQTESCKAWDNREKKQEKVWKLSGFSVLYSSDIPVLDSGFSGILSIGFCL